MAPIFQNILPLRHRSRSTDRNFSPQYGDVSITAPTQGSWTTRRTPSHLSESPDPESYQPPTPPQPSAFHGTPTIVHEFHDVDDNGDEYVTIRIPLHRGHNSQSRGRAAIPRIGRPVGESPKLGDGHSFGLPPSTWTRRQQTLELQYTSPVLGSGLSPVDETFAKNGPSIHTTASPIPADLSGIVTWAMGSANNQPPPPQQPQAVGLYQRTMSTQGSPTRKARIGELTSPVDNSRANNQFSAQPLAATQVFRNEDDNSTTHEVGQQHDHTTAISTAPVDEYRHQRHPSDDQAVDHQAKRSASAQPARRRQMSTDDEGPRSGNSLLSFDGSLRSGYSSDAGFPQNYSTHKRMASDASITSNEAGVEMLEATPMVVLQTAHDDQKHRGKGRNRSEDVTPTSRQQAHEQEVQITEMRDQRFGRSDRAAMPARIVEPYLVDQSAPTQVQSHLRRTVSETRKNKDIYVDIERDYAKLKLEMVNKPPDSTGGNLSTLKKIEKKLKRGDDSNKEEGKRTPFLGRKLSVDTPNQPLPSPNPSTRSWATASSNEGRGPKLVPGYEELWS